MAERRLVISDDLSLPLEAVTEPLGILAARRAGKSNAAVVLAEQMFDNGLHWVAIDPKGDWWGVRSSADGKHEGLPVPIFGGSHADVPLEPGAGALIADLIIDERLTAILDVSGFASEADKIRFLLAFGDRLFRRKEQGQEPTHVFFEEADDYAPQRAFPEQARLVHVMARILKQGGARGLGGTVISQRSAVVHKDLLSQIQTLFALRTTGPQDRKAIKDWVSFTGENAEVVASLPELADGEAWVWSPNWLRITQRIRFHRRRTFDSGATPKVGASRRPPATLTDVDLGALQTRMSATIEKAKADDPKELRKEIAALQRQLNERPPEQVVETVVERVEVPVLNGQVEELREAIGELRGVGEQLHAGWVTIVGAVEDITTAINRVAESATPMRGRVEQEPRGVARPGREARESGIGTAPSTAVATPAPAAPRREPVPAGEARTLAKAERSVLSVLAQYPDGLTRGPLTIQAGYAYSGGFRNTLSALRTAGYIVGGNEQVMAVTEAGRDALGPYDPLPVGRDLLDYWLVDPRLGRAEKAILAYLADRYPDSIAGEELAPLVGYEYSGGFRNNLSKLRTLGLIEGSNTTGVAASGVFF